MTALACSGRYSHSQLSKDNGTVDPITCTGSAPMTPRGKVVIDGVSNFQRALTGACGAALRTWSDLETALVARYGRASADKMLRAISHDTPTTTCRVGGRAAQATSSPAGVVPSARSTTITIVNRSNSPIACGDAVLDAGEWANHPPDTIPAGASSAWRTQSAGAMTGTEGSTSYTNGSSTITVRWSNPYLGSNSASCDAGAGFTCTVTNGSGNDASITVTLTKG